MKMIQISFGEYGPTIASSFFSDEMVSNLLRTPVYTRSYEKGPDGQYSNVFVRQAAIVRYGELNETVFDGTAEEYRNQPAKPKTAADLIADLSAANDQLAEAEQTIAALKHQLFVQSPLEQAEAAE